MAWNNREPVGKSWEVAHLLEISKTLSCVSVRETDWQRQALEEGDQLRQLGSSGKNSKDTS